MEPFQTHLDVTSHDFRRNGAALQALVDELNQRVEAARQGGGPKYVARHSVRRMGRAALSRQLSRTACVEGRTWGHDGRNAVGVPMVAEPSPVAKGARARTIICEYDRDDRHFCPAHTRYGVELRRQLSGATAPSIGPGFTTTAGSGSRGCRAEFTMGR